MTLEARTGREPIGLLLRAWRQRRRLSQLDLALDADISTRHLSYVETGRATPSRAMVLHLAEQLEVPLRERNDLLVAAGFAPMYASRPYTDPALEPARAAVDLILKGHDPYPALLVDRHWHLVSANQAAQAFMYCPDESLLKPPVNVLRLSLHPNGVASRIANLPEWRSAVLSRLARDVAITADPTLAALLAELREYPGGEANHVVDPNNAAVVVPLKMRTPDGKVLSFLSTTTVFGTAVEVTLSELVLEAFYPADDFTAQALRQRVTRSEESVRG